MLTHVTFHKITVSVNRQGETILPSEAKSWVFTASGYSAYQLTNNKSFYLTIFYLFLLMIPSREHWLNTKVSINSYNLGRKEAFLTPVSVRDICPIAVRRAQALSLHVGDMINNKCSSKHIRMWKTWGWGNTPKTNKCF